MPRSGPAKDRQQQQPDVEPVGAPGVAWVAFGQAALLRLITATRRDRGDESGAGPEVNRVSMDEVDAAFDAARTAFAESLGQPGPFAAVVANAGLSLAEAEVLALAAACEVDAQRQRMLAYVQHEDGAPRISLDTLGRALGGQHMSVLALGADAMLRRAALATIVSDGPWSDQRIAIHPTVIWALLGDGGRDPQLPLDLRTVVVDQPVGDALVVVTGPDRLRRQRSAALATIGERFLATQQLSDEATWAAVVREATITGSGVIVEVDEELSAVGRRWIERADHLPWAISSPSDLPIDMLPNRPWTAVDAPPGSPTDAEWAQYLGDLERTHPLTLTQAEIVSRAVDAYDGDLDAAVRRLVGGRLQRLARRIRPTRSWDDIVLSPDRTALLRSLVERYRHSDRVYREWGFTATPSSGLVGLFSGPSGTGKTLAAEIVAGELGLDVFKLDLSAVVSKYIGETEKNLEEVFDAASAGNLLLFFDEADALFGKRSEVRDARDRYANIEVSYLLQRLEVYDGLVVMATNFERNVDDAFLRRIHVRVEFTLPAVKERRAIWERNLPSAAPIKDVDTSWLATRFELTGAGIRNAAVQAGFLAAAADSPITMECAVLGVAHELRKLGRLVKPAEFGEFADLIARQVMPQ